MSDARRKATVTMSAFATMQFGTIATSSPSVRIRIERQFICATVPSILSVREMRSPALKGASIPNAIPHDRGLESDLGEQVDRTRGWWWRQDFPCWPAGREYHAMEACDFLLMLGTDFRHRQFYPTKARIAQIDIRGENLGRRCRLDLGVIGDVREVLSRLADRVSVRSDDSHLSAAIGHYAKARKGLDDLASELSKNKPIHPQLVAKIVSDLANEDAIFTCDVGEPTV
jgi:Thiamine pyrophosphate enzyme, central domain